MSQHHADQSRPPSRVLAAEFQHGLHEGLRGLRCCRPATVVGRGQGVLKLGPEAAEQSPHRTWRDAEALGDGQNILAVPEAIPDRLTHRQGHRARHGPFSMDDETKGRAPTVNLSRPVAKLHVAISWPNSMSRDKYGTRATQNSLGLGSIRPIERDS